MLKKDVTIKLMAVPVHKDEKWVRELIIAPDSSDAGEKFAIRWQPGEKLQIS